MRGKISTTTSSTPFARNDVSVCACPCVCVHAGVPLPEGWPRVESLAQVPGNCENCKVLRSSWITSKFFVCVRNCASVFVRVCVCDSSGRFRIRHGNRSRSSYGENLRQIVEEILKIQSFSLKKEEKVADFPQESRPAAKADTREKEQAESTR